MYRKNLKRKNTYNDVVHSILDLGKRYWKLQQNQKSNNFKTFEN